MNIFKKNFLEVYKNLLNEICKNRFNLWLNLINSCFILVAVSRRSRCWFNKNNMNGPVVLNLKRNDLHPIGINITLYVAISCFLIQLKEAVDELLVLLCRVDIQNLMANSLAF